MGDGGIGFSDLQQMSERRDLSPPERFEHELRTILSMNEFMNRYSDSLSKYYIYMSRHYFHNPAMLLVAYIYLEDNKFPSEIEKKKFDKFFDKTSYFSIKTQTGRRGTSEQTSISSKSDLLRYIRIVQAAISASKRK